MAVQPKIVTYEEWLQMPIVTDEREEVYNGEIRLFPPRKWQEAMAAHGLFLALRGLDGERYFVCTSPFGLIVRKSPLTSRVPALAVIDSETLDEQDGYVHSAPLFIAEVVTNEDRSHQRDEKLLDYASLGVPEFWTLWPYRREVEVFLLDNGVMRLDRVVSDGVIRPTSLPNVEVDVSAIWAR